MWYKSPKDEIDVRLRILHTDKDAMDMARIGMRDNMVELFVVHKDGVTAMKGCTIEKVQEINGGEAAAPTAGTVGHGPIVLHKTQSSAQAKVGKKPKVVIEAQPDMVEDDSMVTERSNFSGVDESEDDDYQPRNDEATDEGDIDEQWSENSSGDSATEVAFDDSDDDWNGEFSAIANKGKEQVVATGLSDEDDGYESKELWDVPVSDDEGDPLLKKYSLYKSLKNMKEYKWKFRTMYVDRNAFKECVTSYAVHSDRGIWFSKCDSHRCKAVCQEGYKWFAYCHKMRRDDIWQLNDPQLALMDASSRLHMGEWERRMEEIHLVDQGVYNHLMEIPTKYWKAREKPIVSMLEDIRVYLMNRFRKPIGRPKLSRNKAGDESRKNGPLSKLSRAGQQQKCSYCFALGHNKRTCPRKRKNAAPQAKKSADTTRTPNAARMQRKQQQKQQQNFSQRGRAIHKL
ncbi:hypothetical protein Ahy_A01g003552 [Arachis hypogaea]|uniref:Transposase MuDR plant domain-containing protein n=1 Tax=Arachis hypogaea TaxID=3818 RepID=A0A445ETL7_ARAHY|nr:hypothetical protein Ahy_A01g003552 [Arachis hypogaea]